MGICVCLNKLIYILHTYMYIYLFIFIYIESKVMYIFVSWILPICEMPVWTKDLGNHLTVSAGTQNISFWLQSVPIRRTRNLSLVNFHIKISNNTTSYTERTRYLLCRRLKFEQRYQGSLTIAAGVCILKMKLSTKSKIIGRQLLPSGLLCSE